MPSSLGWTLCLCISFAYCSAKIDLFITKAEMNRTLGLNSVLQYVTDGDVNKYALQFPYRVRKNISWVNFWWQSHANYDIEYTIRVRSSDEEAVLVSTGDLEPAGMVPRSLAKFTVYLRCTGKKRGPFQTVIELSYAWPSKKNKTTLELIRRKFCAIEPADGLVRTADPGTDEDSVEFVPPSSSSFGVTPAQIFYISIGIVCGFVVVLASLIVAYFSRAKKVLDTDTRHYAVSVASPGYCHQAQPFLRTESPSTNSKYSALTGNNSASAYSAIAGAASAVRRESPPNHNAIILDKPRHIDCEAALSQLRVPPDSVEFGHVELEGTFGQVIWAQWRVEPMDPCEGQDRTAVDRAPVLVKCLKTSASEWQCTTFQREALLLHALGPHPNLAQVVAATWFDGGVDRPTLCYGHAGYGNLKKFLLHCRGVEAGQSLRTQELVYMAIQIVRAMLHLQRHFVVHKDVAARNCLISEDLTVQLCDAALSRDLFPQDYHCLGDNENRPVKWMATEALQKHEFSSASDVWSFGVTCWELLTCAQQPYMEIEADEMSRTLLDGHRLAQPYNCPDELYGVIFCCWGQYTKSRPTFDQLLVALEDFYLQLTEYI